MQPCGHSKNPIKQPSNDLSNYPIQELESIFSAVSASTKKEKKRNMRNGGVSALVFKAGLITRIYTYIYILLPTNLPIDRHYYNHSHSSHIIYYLLSILICYINAFKILKLNLKFIMCFQNCICIQQYTPYYIDRFQVCISYRALLPQAKAN